MCTLFLSLLFPGKCYHCGVFQSVRVVLSETCIPGFVMFDGLMHYGFWITWSMRVVSFHIQSLPSLKRTKSTPKIPFVNLLLLIVVIFVLHFEKQSHLSINQYTVYKRKLFISIFNLLVSNHFYSYKRIL